MPGTAPFVTSPSHSSTRHVRVPARECADQRVVAGDPSPIGVHREEHHHRCHVRWQQRHHAVVGVLRDRPVRAALDHDDRSELSGGAMLTDHLDHLLALATGVRVDDEPAGLELRRGAEHDRLAEREGRPQLERDGRRRRGRRRLGRWCRLCDGRRHGRAVRCRRRRHGPRRQRPRSGRDRAVRQRSTGSRGRSVRPDRTDGRSGAGDRRHTARRRREDRRRRRIDRLLPRHVRTLDRADALVRSDRDAHAGEPEQDREREAEAGDPAAALQDGGRRASPLTAQPLARRDPGGSGPRRSGSSAR